MEKRNSEMWGHGMLADCCWSLIRDTPTGDYEGKEA
jgi:hypothetical protein